MCLGGEDDPCHVAGSLTLSGSRCDVGGSSPGEVGTWVRGFRLLRSADGVSFSGNAHWEQDGFWERQGLCNGMSRWDRAGDLQIVELKRAQ